MSQATIVIDSMEAKKTYPVNIKGLIMHFADVLFGKSKTTASVNYDANLLSAHMRRDLGL